MSDCYEQKPISAEARQARKALREVDAKMALSEPERAQKAFVANCERLRGEGFAREAAATETLKVQMTRSKWWMLAFWQRSLWLAISSMDCSSQRRRDFSAPCPKSSPMRSALGFA
jgi:hypothetical protein